MIRGRIALIEGGSGTVVKSFRHSNPFAGKHLRGFGSLITLTGQFVREVVEDDSSVAYIIDTIFLLKGFFDYDGKDPGRIGDWLELEL